MVCYYATKVEAKPFGTLWHSVHAIRSNALNHENKREGREAGRSPSRYTRMAGEGTIAIENQRGLPRSCSLVCFFFQSASRAVDVSPPRRMPRHAHVHFANTPKACFDFSPSSISVRRNILQPAKLHVLENQLLLPHTRRISSKAKNHSTVENLSRPARRYYDEPLGRPGFLEEMNRGLEPCPIFQQHQGFQDISHPARGGFEACLGLSVHYVDWVLTGSSCPPYCPKLTSFPIPRDIEEQRFLPLSNLMRPTSQNKSWRRPKELRKAHGININTLSNVE